MGDFQQCGISDEPLQPPDKLRNSKCRSVSSLTVIEYSNNYIYIYKAKALIKLRECAG